MTLAALLAAAIAISSPHLSKHTRAAYAKAIAHDATRAHVDPMLVVAIIENESRWHTGAVGGSKADPSIGLGQVRLRNYHACAASLESKECRAVKAMLLTAAGNIHATVAVLKANRRHCGHRLERYLAGYQTGRCKPVRVTWRVLRRRRVLTHAAHGATHAAHAARRHGHR